MKALAKGAALGVLTCVALAAVADDQDAVDYRKHVMSTLGEQAAAIDQIIAKKAPADAFAVHVKTIAIAAGQTKLAFERLVIDNMQRLIDTTGYAQRQVRINQHVRQSGQQYFLPPP